MADELKEKIEGLKRKGYKKFLIIGMEDIGDEIRVEFEHNLEDNDDLLLVAAYDTFKDMVEKWKP